MIREFDEFDYSGGSGGGTPSAPSAPSAPFTPSSPFGTVAEAYHTGDSGTSWQDITGEGDLDIDIDPDYQKYLWEYDPYKEQAIRAGAYGNIEGQYADAMTQMMKTRQPSRAAGSFAGAGSSLLDMTTQDLYGGVERGTRGSILDMMTDITGERTGYREDIIDRLMQIQQMRGEEFENVDRDAPDEITVGTTRQKPGTQPWEIKRQYWNGERWVDIG